jgi:predicted permease
MLAGLVARARSLWRALRGRRELEADMDQEFRLHLELRTADLVRQGLSPSDAARRARLEFGHIGSHKNDARDARGLRWFDQLAFSWLDVKLGLRMLRKYPGLSLVAVVGMSVAIAIGAGVVGFISSWTDLTLPLDQGDRVVSLQNNDAKNPGAPNRRALHDFVVWRDQLRSVKDLGAFTTDRRNLIIPGRGIELVRVAQMSASGFRVARVPPLLGRLLLDDDEQDGAPPVVVIAYEEWRRRFDGDPDILGRPARLGTDVYTVVGVMPQGFRFPINHHYWVPLRLNAARYERGGGPSIYIFGRLADGVALDEARAELATIGRQMAAAYPTTHGQLRPVILPYALPFFDIDSPGMELALHALKVTISLLLVVVAVNVAVLVYARTATRSGEIVVRTALGASRRRVLVQLFAEALVLSGIAAALGLTLASIGLAVTVRLAVASGAELPFWTSMSLSPGLIAYVAGLAILAAVIVGVLPAVKATGRRVQLGLQHLSSRGTGMQLGRVWAGMIVAQVAVAVAILPYAMSFSGDLYQRGTARAGFPIERFLRASLSMERDEAPPAAEAAAYQRAFEARFRDRAAELLRRLEAEPGVAGVTFARHFPGDELISRMEVEGPATGTKTTSFVNDVAVNFFEGVDIPILAGRGFTEADGREGSNAAIVDRVFAQRVLGGSNALGRRVRVVADGGESRPWLEIVGVVPDVPSQDDFDPEPKLYRPVALARAPTVLTLAVRVTDGPVSGFAPRLREMTAAVDPTLQLHELKSAAQALREDHQAMLAAALVVLLVTGSVLLLSAAGIYAMMSFTVARRRREIGIRQALGADPRRILSGIFARASAQLGAGVVSGLLLATAVAVALARSGPISGRLVALLLIAAGVMMAVGLMAAAGPALRGLRVQPTEALKEE